MATRTISWFSLLLGLSACVLVANPAAASPCDMNKAQACFVIAVTSYTRNSRGEAAVTPGQMNPQDAQTVGMAMGTPLTTPGIDLNQICSVVEQVDYKTYTECILNATNNCETSHPTEEDMPDTIPSFRLLDMATTVKAGISFCDAECKTTLPSKIEGMKVCWETAKTALKAAEAGTATPEQCAATGDYMNCQWRNSSGCPYLEQITRSYIKMMKPTVTACNVVLPEAIYADQKKAAKKGVTGSSNKLRPQTIVQIVFVVLQIVLFKALSV